MPQVRVAGRTRRALLGLPAYAVATLSALVSPEASVMLDGALSLVYLVPEVWIYRLLAPEQRTDARVPGGRGADQPH